MLDEESLYIRLKELFGQEEIQKSLLQKARVLFAKVIDRIEAEYGGDENAYTLAERKEKA